MLKQRLGCLTPIGLLASLVTLLVIGGLSVVQGGTMFSPGELSAASGQSLGGVNSHAELKGQCGACHIAPWSRESMTARCLVCHVQIQSDLEDATTLHGALVGDLASSSCLSCHTEHLGLNGTITHLDIHNFPHEATGFSLLAHTNQPDGKPFVCSDCHGSDLARFAPDVCADCHLRLDEGYLNSHIAAFGDECLACHDGVDIFSNFDHNLTRFALLGKHAQADCQGCHNGNKTRQQLQATPNDCFSCHEKDDAHQGNFGNSCGECHSPDGWLPASFDHNLTNFPLTGAHQNTSCDKCHANSIYKGTLSQCSACHAEPVFHAGLFTAECETCHTTSAWLPATYTEPHAFPLSHGDANTCRDCHPSALSEWTCYTCHDQAEIEQKHKEEGISDFTDCLRCHPDGREADEGDGDGDEDGKDDD